MLLNQTVELYTKLGGINIGNRSPKLIPSTALSVLHQGFRSTRDRSKIAQRVGAQSPYIRSIRLFPRQTRETIRTVLARTNQSSKEKLLNPVGTSSSKILVSKGRFGDILRDKSETAKAKIATGMKKAFSFAETRIQKKYKSPSFQEEFNKQGSGGENPEQFDLEVETETIVEGGQTKQLKTDIPNLDPIAAIGEQKPKTEDSKTATQSSLQTPTECLFCGKLINCNLRSETISEKGGIFQDIAPCRLAPES